MSEFKINDDEFFHALEKAVMDHGMDPDPAKNTTVGMVEYALEALGFPRVEAWGKLSVKDLLTVLGASPATAQAADDFDQREFNDPDYSYQENLDLYDEDWLWLAEGKP